MMAAVEKAQAGRGDAPLDLTPYIIDPAIKVSVLILAYNHEPFIRQAVESALAQETPFVYEIVIGEDCSTDATRAVLVELAQQHPDKIRLLLRESNVGVEANFVDTLRECRGRYVAFLEGDDYWTSPHKLRIQAELMDADPECVLCGHNVALKREDGSVGPEDRAQPKGRNKPRMVLEDMFGAYINTCSIMLRHGVLREIPAAFGAGDKDIQVLVAQYGAILYIDEVMATYRMHSASVFNPLSKIVKARGAIDLLERMDAYFDFKYHERVVDATMRPCLMIAEHYYEQAVHSGAIEENLNALRQEMNERPNRGARDLTVQSKVLGTFFVNVGFALDASGDKRGARECMLNAFRRDPALMRNRGAWSVVLRGALPAWMVRPVKTAVRWLGLNSTNNIGAKHG